MSKTKLISTDIKEAIKELDVRKKEVFSLEKKIGKVVVGTLKEFIRSSDDLEAVKWSQYTPHFNDGDVCEFGVNELEFKFSEEVNKLLFSEENHEDREWIQDYGIDDAIEERADILNVKQMKKLQDVVDSARKLHEVLKDMDKFLISEFGDHTEVLVTKKGIETEEYEHD